MHILIAGGTGLIGKALVAELLANDERRHEVTVLSRQASNAVAINGASVVHWDAETPTGWAELISSVDGIVNLAGENLGSGIWTEKKKDKILSSRVEGGRALVQAVRSAAQRPTVIIQASAVGYYGSHGDEPLDESASAGTDWLSNVAVQWEASTQELEQLGLRHITIRIGLVLDRNAKIMRRLALPFRLFVGGPIGNGRQIMSWIHIADAVAAIRFLLENSPASGPYNLASPDSVSNRDFGRTLARVLHRPYWIPMPGFALRLILGEKAQLVLTGQRASCKKLQALGFKFRFPDLQTALEHLLVQ